jgi:small-conductance mechanosensitive channel
MLALSTYEAMLACTIFLAALAALILLKAFTGRQLRRLAESRGLHVLGYPRQVLDATRLPFLCAVALLITVSQLPLPSAWDKWLQGGWVVVLMSQLALWGNRIISVAVAGAFERNRQSNPAGVTHLMVAGLIGRILLWSVAVLLTLDNLGFNITTLMASLGIGGIAVALAVQNILGDVFSSVSIALDKPFVIGDFIIVDDYMGTVEYVGLKTTRLRSLGGEQIVVSNSELLKCRIRNYKRMQERRVVLEFGVAYDTTPEQLRRIPQWVRNIVEESSDLVRFDRAHFKACGESALQFEVVYYVLDPDFNKHMDIQQTIHFALVERLRRASVAFGHPMRTLHLASMPEPTLAALRA